MAQLATYGTADIVLTGSPQITYFKLVYRRHTNFAMESLENAFSGPVDFDRQATCQISRNGDLIYKMWLQVTLPDLCSFDITPAPTINTNEGNTVDATTKLRYNATTRGYYRNNSGVDGTQIAYYNTNNGKYYTESGFTNEIVTWPYMIARDTNYNNSTTWVIPSQRVRWCNGVGYALMKELEIEIGGNKIDKHYSDWWDIYSELTEKEEKRQGLWDMVGKYDVDTYNSTYSREQSRQRTYYIPLTFCFQRTPGLAIPLIALQYHNINVNVWFRNYLDIIKTNLLYASDSTTISSLTSKTGGRIPSFVDCKLYVDFLYLDAEERRRFSSIPHEYLIETLQFLGDQPIDTGTTNQKIQLTFSHPVKELIWTYTPLENYNVNTYSGNKIFEYSMTDQQYAAEDPVDSVKLLINGQDRFTTRPGAYFRLVQPYQHHTRVPSKKIYTYSFALNPEDAQPSGSINYSRIDSSQLQLFFNSNITQGRIRVYATSYNVLRIASGQGGLAFSS